MTSTIGHLPDQTQGSIRSIRPSAALRRMTDSPLSLSPGARVVGFGVGSVSPSSDKNRLMQTRRPPTNNPSPITIPHYAHDTEHLPMSHNPSPFSQRASHAYDARRYTHLDESRLKSASALASLLAADIMSPPKKVANNPRAATMT